MILLSAGACDSFGAGCGGGMPAADAGGVVAPTGSSDADGGPTDIPFSLVELAAPNGSGTVSVGVRFVLQFELGTSTPISAWIDTGSEGIQILESSLPDEVMAGFNSIGTTALSEEFESGIEATGVIAIASVTLGGLTTPSPIPILLIQHLACAAGFPCATSSVPLEQDIFNGYSAIVGIGMRSSSTTPPLGSPIPQMAGHPSYIVKAPAFGGTSGKLRIGPGASEVAAYQTVQLQPDTSGVPLADGTPVWDDSSVPSCLYDTADTAQYCAPSVLDTGAPATIVEWENYDGPSVLPSGDDVQITVGPTSAPIGQFSVVVGSTPQPGLDLFYFSASTIGEDLINFGTTIFYRYDVYFDQTDGLIGLSSH